MDDLISRKWLVECINEEWFDTVKDYNRMIHLVRDTAPSVYPERKKGNMSKPNFCPNCGSDMRGNQDDTD